MNNPFDNYNVNPGSYSFGYERPNTRPDLNTQPFAVFGANDHLEHAEPQVDVFSIAGNQRVRNYSSRHLDSSIRMDQFIRHSDIDDSTDANSQDNNDENVPNHTIVIDVRNLLTPLNLSRVNIEQFENEAFDPSVNYSERCPDCKMKTAKQAIHFHVKILSKDERNSDCCICLQKQNIYAKILDCGHYFHINCIDNWIAENSENVCPLCRGS